jgi:carbon starvation protein
MIREEVGAFGGAAALVAVFSIMIILLAVLALVVVNALADSPWGTPRRRQGPAPAIP